MSLALGKIKPLMKREFLGINRNALLLLIILLLPVALGFMFGTFKDILPRGTPSLVIKSSENVSEADLKLTAGIVSGFSSPVIINSSDVDKYKLLLLREEVYFIVLAQKDIAKGIRNVDVYVDYSMTPISELAPYVSNTIAYEIEKRTYVTPQINVNYIGKKILPFEYFVPGVIVLLAAAIGLLLVPFTTARDATVIPRILNETGTWVFYTNKIIFAVFLVLLQVMLFILTQNFAGLNSSSVIQLNLLSVYVIITTTVFLTSLGLLIMFLFRFTELGKQVNSLVFGAVIVFSGIFYPAGFFPKLPMPILNSLTQIANIAGVQESVVVSFYSSFTFIEAIDSVFSSLFQSIARIFPTYYSVISLRGFGVRGLEFNALGDYVGIVTVSAIVMVTMLNYVIDRRRRYG